MKVLVSFYVSLAAAAIALSADVRREQPPLLFAPVGERSDDGDERPVQLRLRATGLWWHDTEIPCSKLPGYVNGLLKHHAAEEGKAGGVFLYVSEDVTFGSLIEAIDLLRGTDALFISVNMNVLKEPNQSPEPTRASAGYADETLEPRGSS